MMPPAAPAATLRSPPVGRAAAVQPVFWLWPSWASAAPRDHAPLHAASALSPPPYSVSASSPAARLPRYRTGPPLCCPYVTPLLGLFDPASCPLLLPLL